MRSMTLDFAITAIAISSPPLFGQSSMLISIVCLRRQAGHLPRKRQQVAMGRQRQFVTIRYSRSAMRLSRSSVDTSERPLSQAPTFSGSMSFRVERNNRIFTGVCRRTG